MSREALRQILNGIGLNLEGQNYVLEAVLEEPARKVDNKHGKNLVGDIHSSVPATFSTADVSWRLQVESMSGEFAFAVLAQADARNKLLIDQPKSVPLLTQDVNGKPRRVTYTPDFLVVSDQGASVIEIKPLEELEARCLKLPGVWQRAEGHFRFIPAEDYFARLGIRFEVIATEAISWLRVQNLRLLSNCELPLVSPDMETRIRAVVALSEPCSITHVVESLKLKDATPVLALVARGPLEVDLDRVSLADPNGRILCVSITRALEVGAGIERYHSATSSAGAAIQGSSCHPRYLSEVGYRLSVVHGEDIERYGRPSPSERTVQRWKKAYSEGGVEGLFPRWKNQPKRDHRVPGWHLELLTGQLRADRGSVERPTITQSHVRYCELLRSKCGIEDTQTAPYSYQHYCRLWKTIPGRVKDAYQVGGRRLANASAPHSEVDQQRPLASGPFQVAHIDHCLAPSYTKGDHDDKGRLPWLSTLVDDFNNEPLAWSIAFVAPSFEADGLVIRDCIRRHGRVPKTILADGGSDFKGLPFKACLAELGLDLIFRPRANPRSGAAVERTFGTFATTICKGAIGYVPNLKNLRQISRSKHPLKLKPRELSELLGTIEEFLMETLPTLPRAESSISPRESRLDFEAVYGKQGVVRSLDFGVMVATSPEIKSKGHVEPSGVLRFGARRFYSTALRGLDLPISRLAPRRDPELPNQIYIRIGDRWHVAKMRQALQDSGTTALSGRARALSEEMIPRPNRAARAEHLHGQRSAPPLAIAEGEPLLPDDQPPPRNRVTTREWDEIQALPIVEYGDIELSEVDANGNMKGDS